MTTSQLTSETVLTYLRERSLLNDVDVSRLSVTEISRRNYNLAINIDGRPGWFVKQLRYKLPEVVFSQYREAQCYQIVQEVPSLAKLSSLMPRFILFDPIRSILITELLDGLSAADADAKVGASEAGQLAGLLGRALALLHNETPLVRSSALWPLLPAELPWVLRATLRNEPFSERADFLAHIKDDATIARELSKLRENWRRDTLIHGDSRPDNFLFCKPAAEQAEIDTRIVDWELADIGDSIWDCAGIMQYFWHEWIRNTPPNAETWSRLKNSAESYWSAYATRRGEDPMLDTNLFRRVTQFTGARLVQTSYETYAQSQSWTPVVARCARAAQLLLADTDAALKELRAL